MITFAEAMLILEEEISACKAACYIFDKPRSNPITYFFNLVNWGTPRGGEPDYHCAVNYMKDIKSQMFSDTKEIIDFSAEYLRKDDVLAGYIRKAVIKIAGFTAKNINELGHHCVMLLSMSGTYGYMVSDEPPRNDYFVEHPEYTDIEQVAIKYICIKILDPLQCNDDGSNNYGQDFLRILTGLNSYQQNNEKMESEVFS